MSATDISGSVQQELRWLRRVTWVGVILLFAGLLGWAAYARVDTAVVSSGEIRPDQSRLVQQLEAGRIKTVIKHDGDRVEAGEPILVLDDNGLDAELSLMKVAHLELVIRRSYLKAKASGSTSLQLPNSVTEAADDERLQTMVTEYRSTLAEDDESEDSARRVGQSRLDLQQDSTSRLSDRADSIRDAISKTNDQLDDLDQAKPEDALQAATLNRSLESLEAQLDEANEGREASLAAEDELRAQLKAEDDQSKGEIQAEIASLEADITAADLQMQQAESQVRRLTVRAPVDGVIHHARPLSEGDVIGAGESAIEVIPVNDGRIAVVRIQAADVDAIKQNAPAAIKLSAFAPGTVPDLHGTTTHVASAPDVDADTGASTYLVHVRIDPADLARVPNPEKVIAGMPVEAFFTVGETRVLNYLVSPLLDQIRRSAPG